LNDVSKFILIAVVAAALLVLALGGWAVRSLRPAQPAL
jgi:hypothetical protein